MKHLYLFFLLFSGLWVNAQITLEPIPDFMTCDDSNSNDGIAPYDLYMYSSQVLGSLDNNLYNVTFFESYSNALQDINQITTTYYNTTPYTQTLYARVTENANFENYGIAPFNLAVYDMPSAHLIDDFTLCSNSSGNNETAVFDLTSKNAEIMGTYTNCTVTYAVTGDFREPILNPESFVNTSNPQTLNVRVMANNGNCSAITTLTLRVVPTPPAISLPPLVNSTLCTYNLYDNNNLYNPEYTLSFYWGESDAQEGIRAITGSTINSGESGSVWVRVVNPLTPQCFTILQQELLQNTANINIDDQTVTVIATGVGELMYTLDNAAPQSSNIFENVSYGSHIIEVSDTCGVTTIAFTLSPDAPDAEETQTFTPGQTLADLEISGENIQWYATETGGEPLPLSTPLEDGVTYYASQTIDGVPSARRLGVRATFALGINQNVLSSLVAYPIPATSVLNIKNTSLIYSAQVYNTLGQAVLNTAINAPAGILNVSGLSNGIYFIRVHTETGQKTIKIIKE